MVNYATALDFIQQFGAHSSAELLDSSENNSLTAACLLAGAKDADLVDFEADDIVAQGLALQSLNRHLSDAKSEINSYLIGRYNLPISEDAISTSPLKRVACDMTRYLIASNADLMSDIIADRYKDGIKWLKDVSNGRAQLSISGQISDEKASGTAGVGFTTGIKVQTQGY